ncbi:MAG: hypothetical protein ACK5TK_06500 [Betaproteobacteria bacterium]
MGEYYDDNWLRVSVRVSAGAFAGLFDATFLTSEFVGFRESLGALHDSLIGSARFSTLEEQLVLDLTGDRLGHITLRGVATDAPGIGNRLQFQLALDQSHLSVALRDLDAMICTFPVRAG